MKVQVANVEGYKEPQPIKGLCTVRITKVTDYETTGRSRIEYEILDAPIPEAQGRKIFEFELLDLTKAKSEKQEAFVGRMLVARCLCFGLDPEDFDTQDFTGAEGRVWVFEQENKDTKRRELNITKFYPNEE